MCTKAITLKEIHQILIKFKEAIEMATDPVCLMIVDEEEGKFTSIYRERTFYFCCNWCKNKFDENPKRYSRISPDVSVDLKQVT